MNTLEASHLERLRARLVERAAALRDEVRRVQRERDGPPTRLSTEVQDSAEQGEQRSREAVSDAEQDRDSGELRDIGAALERMDAGEYGLCTDCELEIPPARLEVQPAAARCIECQERRERELAGFNPAAAAAPSPPRVPSPSRR
ncbi:MAG TPA: TraR/DksA family transcriptional regulator [Methylibium sp.]|uniref:TraR/DksA family transcriptional regulator n=1 Tax=Methylibium sp. TaxID=2067992 RepID=UPI002DB84FC9|nr:TraR/DksA family transcriptional regulator [Methylibium sp.]HEU4459143.1 TraR/DksA family transcriptional regulator [Methylibium sp.]